MCSFTNKKKSGTVIVQATEIVDNYFHPDDNIEYILENVLSDSVIAETFEQLQLKEQYHTALINTCACLSSCYASCCHGGNYNFVDLRTPELVLSQYKQEDFIYECSSFCQCSPNCLNRLVQNGPRKHLEVINSTIIGSKGLITTKDIPKGAFICEYAGELLTQTEALQRSKDNDKNLQMNYILCLNEINFKDSKQMSKTFIDPQYKGNIGRYINHSCNPNCKLYSVRIDCPIPKVAIFSNREILAGEELCFHYSGGLQAVKQHVSNSTFAKRCLCSSAECEKYLPSISF